MCCLIAILLLCKCLWNCFIEVHACALQIRVHLAHAGHAIIGDDVYGLQVSSDSIFCICCLVFCPTGSLNFIVALSYVLSEQGNNLLLSVGALD